MSHSPHILIVDDEDVVLQSVIKICNFEGMTVDVAMDGHSALEKVRDHHYRLIISDIMMPGFSGLQLLNELTACRVQTPVVMTTGYTTVENAAESIMLGAIDFLPKPFTVDELLSVIHRGLRYAEIIGKAAEPACGTVEPAALDARGCPDGYYRLGYTAWVHLDGTGLASAGVTPDFLRTIDRIVSIELFDRDTLLSQGGICARVGTTGGEMHNVLCALSGNIMERNDELCMAPESIYDDPYGTGRLYTIMPTEFQMNVRYLARCTG
jgi:CheY-like chemotaxis protein/glycine cleavage system H lipoate-binding protein